MKKIALFSMAALFSAVLMASCKSNPCINCSGIKYCKDTYTTSRGASWDEFSDTMIASGCTVD